MERTVDVSARVGDHLDLADLKFRPWGILGARGFPAKPVADYRRRESLVRHHSVFDGMANVDQSPGRHSEKCLSAATFVRPPEISETVACRNSLRDATV